MIFRQSKKFIKREKARRKKNKNPFINQFTGKPMSAKQINKVARTKKAQRYAGFSV